MFSKQDPFNRRIKLKKTTWEYKICNYHNTNTNGQHGNSHSDMESLYNEVIESVEQPHYILKDTEIKLDENGEEIEVPSQNREEFLKIYFDKDEKMGIIKTVVEFDENNEGDIITTHKMNGRIKGIKKGAGIIYDSSKRY